MAGTTLDLERLVHPDQLATQIAEKYQEWSSLREKWSAEKVELIKYIYATDTKTTSNKSLPWANSTTTPKLTQIYDNLKANYEAALFPNSMWMTWVARDKDANKDGSILARNDQPMRLALCGRSRFGPDHSKQGR